MLIQAKSCHKTFQTDTQTHRLEHYNVRVSTLKTCMKILQKKLYENQRILVTFAKKLNENQRIFVTFAKKTELKSKNFGDFCTVLYCTDGDF